MLIFYFNFHCRWSIGMPPSIKLWIGSYCQPLKKEGSGMAEIRMPNRQKVDP